MGACRSYELHAMEVEHLQDLNLALFITVPNTKNKSDKYMDLRPPTNLCVFLLNYQSGKCRTQKVGIPKFGGMAKEVAKYLNLTIPELYTGHCVSATLLVDGGRDMSDLKRHGEWQSTSVAEGCIAESLNNKMKTARKILHQVESNQESNICFVSTSNHLPDSSSSTSLSFYSNSLAHVCPSIANSNYDLNFEFKGIPIQLSNRSGNFSFNFYSK